MHFTLILHIDDVQCSASCWLLTISTIAIVIQPIKSSANLSHHLMGVGGGGGGEAGRWEERRVCSLVKLQSWQIGKLICCLV